MPKRRFSAEDYIERIQPEILYCRYCQPFDEGNVEWILGERIGLEGLFDNHRVPDKFRDKVAEGLHCEGCGAQLGRWADVGVAYEFEVAHERFIDTARKKYEGLLVDFAMFLREYPYLGAKHKVGKKLLKEIGSFPVQEIRGQTWYRARRVSSGARLTIADMFPPDPTHVAVPAGRYNHASQAYWYLSSTKEAAVAEAVGPSEEWAWVQAFQIENTIRVLDVRAWEADDERFLSSQGESAKIPLSAIALVFTDQLVEWAPRDDTQKLAYHVPRFVSDAAKNAGFAGIIFKSPRHYEDNLVLFQRKLPLRPKGMPVFVSLPEFLLRIRETGLFYIGGAPMPLSRDLPFANPKWDDEP